MPLTSSEEIFKIAKNLDLTTGVKITNAKGDIDEHQSIVITSPPKQNLRALRAMQDMLFDSNIGFTITHTPGKGTIELVIPNNQFNLPKQVTVNEIIEAACKLKLGTCEPDRRSSIAPGAILLIQKTWTNPDQVEGFVTMQEQLRQWGVKFTVGPIEDDDYCCYIIIPEQPNIFSRRILRQDIEAMKKPF